MHKNCDISHQILTRRKAHIHAKFRLVHPKKPSVPDYPNPYGSQGEIGPEAITENFWQAEIDRGQKGQSQLR